VVLDADAMLIEKPFTADQLMAMVRTALTAPK